MQHSTRILISLLLAAPLFGQGALFRSATSAPAAGIALITHTSARDTGTSNVTTSAIDTSGANFLIAVTGQFSGAGTFSDSKSNTWTGLTTYGSTYRIKLYYCANATVGSGHTFTLTANGAFFSTIVVASFSNVKTSSPIDGAETGLGDQSGSTIQPGSITAGGSGELAVTGLLAFGPGGTSNAVNSSFILTDQDGDGSVSLGYGMAYKIVSGAENPTWTPVSAAARSATMAVFQHQ